MRIIFNDLRASSGWRIVAAALTSLSYLVAQTNKPAQPTTVAQVLALAADPKANVDYQRVHQVLDELDPEARKSISRLLIAAPHENLSSIAVIRMLKDGDVDSAGIIASRITTWHSDIQGTVLDRVVPVRGSSWRFLVHW